MSTTKEPLLWTQLLGIGFIPLEFLLLQLILAGAPLGPLPTTERILISVIAIIIPTISFYKKPADWASLLFIRLPLKGRSVTQHQISSIQLHVIPKLFFLLGVILITFLYWAVDESALLLAPISPFKNYPRIINLMISIPLLYIIIWQWHQVCQSIWLLTRSTDVFNKATYLTSQQILSSHICLGIETKCVDQLSFSSSLSSTPININQSSKNE